MISLLTATQNNSANMLHLCQSIEDTAHYPKNIEVIFYISIKDKKTLEQYYKVREMGFATHVYAIIGEPITTGDMWNRCVYMSMGHYYMLCADNIVFKTRKWDAVIKDKFEEYPDKIVLLQGENTANVCYPFVHKNWIAIAGRLCPPHFTQQYSIEWITKIADTIKRRESLPNVLTEQVYSSNTLEKGIKDNEIEQDFTTLLRADAHKLLKFIGGW